jgi:hypothetical protein
MCLTPSTRRDRRILINIWAPASRPPVASELTALFVHEAPLVSLRIGEFPSFRDQPYSRKFRCLQVYLTFILVSSRNEISLASTGSKMSSCLTNAASCDDGKGNYACYDFGTIPGDFTCLASAGSYCPSAIPTNQVG